MKKAVIDFEICSMVYLYSVELISANVVEFARMKERGYGINHVSFNQLSMSILRI